MDRHVYWESPEGLEVELEFERFVSLGILCSGAAFLLKERSVPLTEAGLFAMEQRMVREPLRQEMERLCRNGQQQG